MTRARDELVLSHAADYGGQRARRVSPFVLEALDLPVAAGAAGAGAKAASPLERLAGLEQTAGRARGAARALAGEPLMLSFYAIDDYLTCPLKYKFAHLLRVPLAPHHSIIYGSALHAAVAEFHKRHARGDVMTEEALFEAFMAAWRNEGFLSREHEEARLAAGRAALHRFREEQLAPGRRDPGLRGAGVQLHAGRGPGPRPLRPRGHHAPGTAGGTRGPDARADRGRRDGARRRRARTSWSRPWAWRPSGW